MKLIEISENLQKPLFILDIHKLTACTHNYIPKGDYKDIKQFYKKLYAKVNEVSLNLKSESICYPYLVEHCILWSRYIFITYFTKLYDDLNEFLINPEKFLLNISERKDETENFYVLELIKVVFIHNLVNSYIECVDIAIDYFWVNYLF